MDFWLRSLDSNLEPMPILLDSNLELMPVLLDSNLDLMPEPELVLPS